MAQPSMGVFDPDQWDIDKAQQKRDLALQMVGNVKANGTGLGGILGLFNTIMGQRQVNAANEELRAATERKGQRYAGDMEGLANLLTMRPQGPQAQTNPVANDDEGNPMPAAPMTLGESPDAFQERRMALAKSMITSPNPQVAQFAMQNLMPQPKDYKTVKNGEKLVDFSSGVPKVAFDGGPSLEHFAPKDYTPESYAKFRASNNPADLRRYEKPDLDANVIIGPDGRPMVNPLAVDAKKQIAAAGRAPGAPRLQYDPERGGVIDLNTGEFRHVSANGQPIGAKPEKLPGSIQEKLAQNNVSLAKINSALGELETPTGKNALGPVNRAPGAELVRQYTDPEGVKLRALVADIGSQKLHDRSGAAVTISETPRLMPFIPGVGDRPDVAKVKLQNLQKELAMMQSELSKGGSLASIIKSGGGGKPAGGGWSITRVDG